MIVSILLFFLSLLLIYFGIEFFDDESKIKILNLPFEKLISKIANVIRGIFLILVGILGSIYFLREIAMFLYEYINR